MYKRDNNNCYHYQKMTPSIKDISGKTAFYSGCHFLKQNEKEELL